MALFPGWGGIGGVGPLIPMIGRNLSMLSWLFSSGTHREAAKRCVKVSAKMALDTSSLGCFEKRIGGTCAFVP